MFRIRRVKRLISLATIIGFVLIFFRLYPAVGSAATAFAVIPVAAISISYGVVAGTIAGLLTLPATTILLDLVGTAGASNTMYAGGLHGFLVVVFLGAVIGYLGDLRSTVEDKNRRLEDVEDKLRSERDLLRGIVRTSVAAIVVVDRSGRVVFANGRAERILDADGSSHDSLDALLPVQRVLEEGMRLEHIECTLRLSDGQQRYFNINGAPLTDDAGTVDRVVFVIIDQTKRIRALKEARRRDAILAAISFSAEQFLQGRDWEENVQVVLQRLGRATDACRVYVYENISSDSDNEMGDVYTQIRYEWVAPDVKPLLSVPELHEFPLLERGFQRWVEELRRGRILHGRVDTFPEAEQQFLTAHDVKSLLVLPIFVGQTWWGFLGFDNCRSRRVWPNSEIDALRTAAGTLGAAIRRSQIEAVLRRRTEELTALHATTLDSIQNANLPTLLEDIVERAVRFLGADAGELYLCRAESQQVQCVVSFNAPTDHTGTLLAYGEGVAGIVAQMGYPLVINDYSEWEYRADVFESSRDFDSVLSAPMTWEGTVIGVLHMLRRVNTRDFTPQELELVSPFADQAAIAVENARLLEAKQHRAQEAETLREAGAAVAATLEQQEAVKRILEQLQRVVSYDSASVQLLRGDTLEIVDGRGWDNIDDVRGIRFPIGAHNPNSIVIRKRRAHILGDAPAAYDAFREPPHDHIRSWLGVPLIVRDEMIGMLALDSRQRHTFNEDHARLVGAFADQVAIAIENARLFEAEQQRRETTATLLEIMEVASSSLELKQVLKDIAQRTASICRANRCSIFLLDAAGERLQPVMSQFADGHVEGELWQEFKTTTADHMDVVPLFRSAIRGREPVMLHDPGRTDLIPRKWTSPFGIQKLLVVPLIARDRAIGIMALDLIDPSREFSSEQVDLAVTIGGRVAASIENAQLYEEMQELATTDSLTGTYNRRALFELGEREVERAWRFDRPLAVLMFDLDHFKPINDTYGHPVGDEVLVAVVERCQEDLRIVDILVRYGGDEFAIILPETDYAGAQRVAQRLRRTIARSPIHTEAGPIPLTITVGGTVLDSDRAHLEMLLDRADNALYTAKTAGRNRVVIDDGTTSEQAQSRFAQ